MATFAAIVREGSYTAAARSLGITKQSVSERIRVLEQRLGVELLVRTTRALRLTEAGERYHAACTEVLERAEEADRVAKQSQHQPRGTVRITSPVGLSGSLIMPVIERYRQRYPEVHFDVLLDERVLDLLRDRVDIALRAGKVELSSALVARRLFEVDVVHVVHRDVVREHGVPDSVAHLSSFSCITRTATETWAFAGETVSPRARVTVDTYEGALDAARARLGIARVPMILAHEHLESGELVTVLDVARRIKFSAVWPSRTLPPKTRVLFDLLRARARELEPMCRLRS